jgi:dihydroorotate dehydrogenase
MPLDLNLPFLISPPFGQYARRRNAYSVLGSYTTQPRPGRLRQMLSTLRPVPSGAGPTWISRADLRNPGIESLPTRRVMRDHRTRSTATAPPFKPNHIVSLAPMDYHDWAEFANWVEMLNLNNVPIIEINLSHISADSKMLPPKRSLERILAVQSTIIVKLPPMPKSVETACWLYDRGVQYVHLSGPYPAPIGEVSGAPLREINLPLVEELANSITSLNIIGGGGILSVEDVMSYRSAGARWFSLSTAFFRPMRGWRILREGAGEHTSGKYSQ